MNSQGYQNVNAKPYDVAGIIECMNRYIEKYNKVPNTVMVSPDLDIDLSKIPVDVKVNSYLKPYGVFVGHTEDDTTGIKAGDSPIEFRFDINKPSEMPVEAIIEETVTDIPVTPRKRRGKAGKPVYASINGMPSMTFINKHEAGEYFGVSISSININISDNSKSGGMLKLDGVKVKLDWAYDN
jgi:hypothetical protein